MGRKTHASIGRPLAGRRNIVVSRTADGFEGCEMARGLEEAIALARTTDEEPRIIGGAAIYEAALPLATRIFLTEVHRAVDGDAFFHLDRAGWRETSRKAGESEGVEFVTLER
jgi:dihydrofolate reductase